MPCFYPAGLTQSRVGSFTLFDLQAGISQGTRLFLSVLPRQPDKDERFRFLSNTNKQSWITDIKQPLQNTKRRIRLGFPNAQYVSGPGFWAGGSVFDQADLGFKLIRHHYPDYRPVGNIWCWAAGAAGAQICRSALYPRQNVCGQSTPKLINRGRVSDYGESILEYSAVFVRNKMGQGYGLIWARLYQPTDRWECWLYNKRLRRQRQ